MTKFQLQLAAFIVTTVGTVLVVGFWLAAVWTHHQLSQSLLGTGAILLFALGVPAMVLWMLAADKEDDE